MFKAEAMAVKSERLEWLKSKSDKINSQGKTSKSNYETEGCSTKNSRKWVKKSKYRRLQKQKKKQKISVVFNYSKMELTPAMEKVLNRGLNFAILPLKLNMTQVLADFNKFERNLAGIFRKRNIIHRSLRKLKPISLKNTQPLLV